ncbi:MAG: hypothetical protein ABI091_20640, partial [Ferruginibacter sp.]
MSEEEKIEPPTDESQPATERNVVKDELQIDNEITEPSTIINEPSTIMEVQKHPHHVMHKKRWGEYLLEFFMLFLAVFLGFVAENVREGQVERVKEKEYMHSLVKDLEADTSIINETVKYNERMYTGDSLLLPLLQLPNKDSQTLRKIYTLYFFTQNFSTEINDPKTFEQLKSTGDMRLVKNKAVLDSMAKYYQYIAVTQTFRDEIQSQLQLTYNLSFKIFDQYAFDNNANTPAPL